MRTSQNTDRDRRMLQLLVARSSRVKLLPSYTAGDGAASCETLEHVPPQFLTCPIWTNWGPNIFWAHGHTIWMLKSDIWRRQFPQPAVTKLYYSVCILGIAMYATGLCYIWNFAMVRRLIISHYRTSLAIIYWVGLLSWQIPQKR